MNLPSHAPRSSQSFSGQTPVHFEGHPDGPFVGIGMNRGLKDFEHATICRAFGLDQARFYFDLPSSVRGIGSSRGEQRGGRRTIEGFVFMAGFDKPVATLYVLTDADRLRDMNPLDAREYESFSWRK